MSSLIADLDLLVEESINFKLHGKTHSINAISTIDFLKFSSKLSALNDTFVKENLSGEELISSYFDLIFSVCNTVTLSDVEKCTQPQIAALLNLIIQKVTGKLTEDKKKTLLKNPTEILRG